MTTKVLSVISEEAGRERVSCVLHHCAASAVLSTAAFCFSTEFQGQVSEQRVSAHLFYVCRVCVTAETRGERVEKTCAVAGSHTPLRCTILHQRAVCAEGMSGL